MRSTGEGVKCQISDAAAVGRPGEIEYFERDIGLAGYIYRCAAFDENRLKLRYAVILLVGKVGNPLSVGRYLKFEHMTT